MVSFLTPSLMSFTWYYTVIHSLTSIGNLRDYLSLADGPWSWARLTCEAAPLTIATYIGITFGYLTLSQTSVLSMLFIALSALTVPHTRLFHRVYETMGVIKRAVKSSKTQ